MKYKVTKREVMNNMKCLWCYNGEYRDVFGWLDADAYTRGNDGWHADIYEVGGNIAIVTGYKPFGEVRFRMSEDAVAEIDTVLRWHYAYTQETKGKIKDILRAECFRLWAGGEE